MDDSNIDDIRRDRQLNRSKKQNQNVVISLLGINI